MPYHSGMPRLALFPEILREAFGSRTLPREPEPDLVMDGPDQVLAFAEAGRSDGVMAASYLFNSARISQVIQGCRSVVDLGCGPATQLAQVAGLHPGVEFVGIDLSAAMLANAEAHVRELGLTNVRFIHGDITEIPGVADRSSDAVISTLALHHLPTGEHLRQCFRQIQRVLKPGGAVYVADLGRLKSLKSILYFAYMNAKHQPHIFSLDYERSLRAAFLATDFDALCREYLPDSMRVYTPYALPILILAKTADRPISSQLRTELREMRRKLNSRYRRDLDDIRRFFRWGGLGDDPFRPAR